MTTDWIAWGLLLSDIVEKRESGGFADSAGVPQLLPGQPCQLAPLQGQVFPPMQDWQAGVAEDLTGSADVVSGG